MLHVKLNRSRYESSTYYGPCDAYGRRHGFGLELWRQQDQVYEGSFARDTFHGEGSYKCRATDDKLVYEGYFYSNFKEGYGLVSLPDGSVFEGLFCNNRAFGPGVHTHVNGRQDVGFWCGQRMVRLSRSVDFIIPRLASSPLGKLKLLQYQTLMPYVEEKAEMGSALQVKYGFDASQTRRLYSNFISDPRSLFFNRLNFDKVYFVRLRELSIRKDPGEVFVTKGDAALSPTEGERPGSRSDPNVCLEAPDRGQVRGENSIGILRYHATHKTLDRFPAKLPGDLGGVTGRTGPNGELVESSEESDEGGNGAETHLISWNRSELCMEMLKEIFRFRSFEDRLSFKISDLMSGARTRFRKTGDGERCCLQFLKMCSVGPVHIIKDFLCTKNISEALMDASGNNSIMFAAAADQHDILELLLNHGADVNSFNDENLTPLNLCLLRRIAQTHFLGNWEKAFLPPESKTGTVEEAKNSEWRVKTSIESLDRIFGDGMSIDDSKTGNNKIRENWESAENDSVFCFQGESESQSNGSDITLFKYKKATGKNDVTGKMEKEFMPDSYKREEFVKSVAAPTERDKYVFDLSPGSTRAEKCDSTAETSPPVKRGNVRGSGAGHRAHEEGVAEEVGGEGSLGLDVRVANIDKTIELLLKRGADPNLADAPKPSLHLAVYSRDVRLVRLLLMYGASPDSQTLPQEGLLTPLHVLVLMKPARELVEMCELLLNCGASPEEETSPDFNPSGEENSSLDPEHGRTPLQLLCMRRDAECADPQGFLSQLALLLAGVSRRNHFFRGHSYLTLAMISGNHTLMKILLSCKRADPNEVLGRNLGTPLHVLLSTTMQKRTTYEDSVRMCDLLLKSGGNPNVEFKAPPSLAGTCVDYGYREIQEEKLRRHQEGIDSKQSDSKKKNGMAERDNSGSHVRIVEYLAKKSKSEAKGEERGNSSSKSNFSAEQKKGRTNRKEEEKAGEGAKELNGREKGAVGPGGPEKEAEAPRSGKRREQERMARINGTELGSERRRVPEPAKEIIEIKKAAATGREGGELKRSGNAGRRPEGVGSRTKNVRRKKLVEEDKVGAAGAKVMASKDKKSSGARCSNLSERLPERFRQSLLHMFGICSGGVDLNDLLLPYVVLRNGDLYYRFKGQKPAGTEQYSLI